MYLSPQNTNPMRNLINAFTKQLSEAHAIALSAQLKPAKNPINNVVITGLGGSGIGGTIVNELFKNDCKVPVVVNKDYIMPSFINENTLVIASSYSGNTEETLIALEEAMNKGAEIAIITSGGKALEIAQANKFNHIVIPGGNPPRSMLAYSLVQLLALFAHYKLVSKALHTEVPAAVALLENQHQNIISSAEKLAEKLYKKIPIVYAVDGFEGVAVRWKQQINENSKMLSWHAVVPEMNHNELVGWAGGNEDVAVVFLRNKADFNRNQHRVEINKDIIAKYTPHVFEVWSEGDTSLANTLYLINFGDWVSLILSEMNKVDVMEVKVIDFLKSSLAKVE